MGSKDVDDSIEFYAKTRAEHLSSHDHGDAEFADILKKDINEIPMLNNRDFSDLLDDDSSVSKLVLEEQSLEKTDHISMWRMIQHHMVTGLALGSGKVIVRQIDEEEKSETKDLHDDDDDDDDEVNQEAEIRKMFAIKLVRDAIENILLPEVQDDQSSTSELTSDRIEKSPKPTAEEKTRAKAGAPDRWSYIKKIFILNKFIKELEKVKKFNPKEALSIQRQTAGGKKNFDEWMLDYALQKVVSELAPTEKRKVALLVKAFETIAPAQVDSQKSRSNDEIQNPIDESSSLVNEESKPDLEKEKHIKMWHTIYQHVITDIATKIGSDLLLDAEESSTSEEHSMQEAQDQTQPNYMLQFTKKDAIKLIQQSVDEILLPDIVSEQEQSQEKKTKDGSVTKLNNWGKLKKLIMLKRSINALEGYRKVKSQTQQQERVDLRRQMMDERKKAEQWMVDYAVQHIVTKLTPLREKRVSMLVEAFEAVVPFPDI